MEQNVEEKGLTTEEALRKLCEDIENVLGQFHTSQKNRKSKSWIKEALHHTSGRTTITWISSVFTLICAILFLIVCVVTGDIVLYFSECLFIIILLMLNGGLQLYDKKMRQNEIPNRIQRLASTILQQSKSLKWDFENYPHLYSPISPCITLQWTYRDNTVVNLPWALLVKGDVILVRPGQQSPGYCESLDKSSEYPLLHARDVYSPTLHTANEIFSIPTSRKPLEYKKYRLLETPYLNNLRIALEQALDRPISQLNQQKHFLAIKLIERIILPTTLVVVLLVNLIRLIYLETYIGKASPIDLFVLVPVSTILPLLPLTFPFVCVLSDYYGLARFKTLFDECRNNSKVDKGDLEEQENAQITNLRLQLFWKKIWNNFLAILQGNNDIIVRSANIVHVLGSLTALCCICFIINQLQRSPTLHTANEIFSIPTSRKPLEYKKYRLLETPYLNNLRIALEQALDRPISQLNQQKHFLAIKLIERIILPTTLVVVLLVNLIRLIYLETYIGKASPIDLFVLVPVSTILPLLPLTFPFVCVLSDYYGLARFKTLFDECRNNSKVDKGDLEEQENAQITNLRLQLFWKKIWNNFLAILQGNNDIIVRSANIVHVLGSLTALCCIDKKGVLSWPNPTAEKVFFLHNTESLSNNSSLANLGDLHNDGDSLKTGTMEEGVSTTIDTQESYNQFYSHITCEAIYNDNLVPVINRRCLCQLAKEIGFVEQAQKIFSLEQQLSTFRHLQPEMVRRDNKYARTLSLSTKLKFPFPHMFAVVVKELSSGSMQLLSQGTADIILDSCVDYWDGHDLCQLLPSDRKKIQDFYQRSSLTAYCTAFAYRPLSKGVSSKLSQVYLELPSDSRHLYHSHRSPTPVHWDCSRNVLEPKIKSSFGQFFSTDSLLYNDTPCLNVCDAESCFNMQCSQVFIGMVTMQYQAQSDMVDLIEQLERACIRFVHFSKENELRSRVFSEKMGLESGWNCHISLLSDRNSNLETSRTMSFSAPCAINTDHTTVKFDPENVPLMKRQTNNYEIHKSQDSIQMQETYTTQHDWQSLSCLTDSTEHSAPINFDMSNRAKLPRGIDKIRPHIEQIDNVPLLVSLFTDCTAQVTREMLHIMQDYGEVVCVMGSSANNENMGSFMQADASIAVEPLYPQVCQLLPPYKSMENKDILSPIELARRLSSIACSLSVRREEPISIYHLIRESRHYVCSFRNSVQFWLCCCASVSLMQTIAAIFMLPALLSSGQVLWLVCFVIPLLSISLMGTRIESDVMKRPQGNPQVMFNREIAMFVIWCYGCKFLILIIVIILTFAGTLSGYCADFCTIKNCTCILFYLPNFENATNINNNWTDLEHSYTLLSAQNFTVVIITSHFCKLPLNIYRTSHIRLLSAQNFTVVIITSHFLCISASFVHRQNLFFNRSPHHNLMWVIIVIIICVLQTIHTTLSLSLTNYEANEDSSFTIIHAFRIFACCSPLITLIVNELVKSEEIKVNLRYQRRARLDFGTKLGMNSPF
ncbi:hypothetical protein QE152_g1175 [Popillia japonica]|uniref:Transmembrane protein 94 n=1 Tax=Popillia japonica TaxID=7064 RepID=A0AAW1N6M8_POPJA